MHVPRLPLRLVLYAAAAIGLAIVCGLLVSTLNSALELYQRLASVPWWIRGPLLLLFGAAMVGVTLLALRWRSAASHRRAVVIAPPSRDTVESRVAVLRERQADTDDLDAELVELDRRRERGELHVALFGEISAGKSSLVRALVPGVAVEVDVRGGTTRDVTQHRGQLPDGRDVVIADVPGSREVDGAEHERLARDEALRSHVVIYVAASDITAAQDAEIRWLAGFGKPLLIALNKIDQYSDEDRERLLLRLRGRYVPTALAVVPVSAGGRERFERVLMDGRREFVERERKAEIGELVHWLDALTQGGPAELEPAREAAVLRSIDQRVSERARERARIEADACVTRYTRRAIVGAMAAVAPGSDILIQGALGTGLVRELARIHEVTVRDIDIDGLLGRLGLTVRNTTAVILAIAGNALKAFPGLGTLGGGVLHAIAYGLVFDSVGHALADSLAERRQLDLADAERRVEARLGESGRERVERIARLALQALRDSDSAR